MSIKELQKEISELKARNKRVEANKDWELSRVRKIVVLLLTYAVISLFYLYADVERPFINSIVPALAFLLSTMSLSIFKNIWMRFNK